MLPIPPCFPPLTPPQIIKQVMLNTTGLGREGVLEVVVLSKTHYSC